MIFLVNSHTNATRIGWHLWEIDLRFALNSTPGWVTVALLEGREVDVHLAVVALLQRDLDAPTFHHS